MRTTQNYLPLTVDTRTNLPFYGIIARTKSHVFTVIFLAVFPLEPALWPAQTMFFKTEIEQLRSTVSLENIAGNISCESNMKMSSPFRLDTNTLQLFRYTSYLLTEDCRKAWNLLFPPIYMAIEHSFINYSYTAKVYIYIYKVKNEQNQNISCSSFIISLVENNNPY